MEQTDSKQSLGKAQWLDVTITAAINNFSQSSRTQTHGTRTHLGILFTEI